MVSRDSYGDLIGDSNRIGGNRGIFGRQLILTDKAGPFVAPYVGFLHGGSVLSVAVCNTQEIFQVLVRMDPVLPDRRILFYVGKATERAVR